MNPRRVLILGASGSGKSWLAQALTDSLMANGLSVLALGGNHACAAQPTQGTTLASVDWVITEAVSPPSPPSNALTTLLMGLDLPGTGADQQREDRLLRLALNLSQTPFKIIYGQGIHRLNNAFLALGLSQESKTVWQDRELSQFNINHGRDVWRCNDCSDPACEHKLFTGLLSKRSG